MAQPTAKEQELLELINRMRLNPSAELAILLDSADGDVQYALEYYNVNRATLKAQWSHLNAAAPLAWASELNQSAAVHNHAMIAQQQQAHVLPGELSIKERITQAGYQSTTYGENVYAASQSVLFTHTGLAIDWGKGANTVDGIQTPALHRQNLMSTFVTEVGVSAIETNINAPIGPLVVTEDFGTRAALDGKGWLLGVAFQDTNNNGWYNAGEGLGDVSINITGINGTNFSDTIAVAPAGGYQELLNPGQYRVDFSRNGRQISSQTTEIKAQTPHNVKVDLVLPLINLGSNLQDNTTETKVLDFRTDSANSAAPTDLIGKSIALNFVAVTADATYHNYAGLYRVEDAAGTVIDPTNSKSYHPGDVGYVAAALRRAQVTNEGTQLDKNGLAGGTHLKGGYIYAPFIIANGRIEDILNHQGSANQPNIYFNYQAANADRVEHIQLLGANKFGFEDMYGGGDRDYNDLVFQVNAQVV
jgi:uncharacterized protein YkwD